MKVLLISNMFPSEEKPYAGIFVKNQYEYLRDVLRVDVEMFFMKRTFTGKVGSVVKYVRAFLSFAPYLLKRYDIIHVHYYYPLYILAYVYKLLRSGTKIIVTFHGTDITRKIKGVGRRRVFSLLSKRCDYVIAVGRDLALEVTKKLAVRVNDVLSAGVDTRIFFKSPMGGKRFDYLFVGSFNERKGIDLLIEAVRLLADRKVTFCFVGSGVYEPALEALRRDYAVDIKLNQSQDRLRDLYNMSKYFILPSRDEPFGLVATEALYCGTPAIVSATGGLKDQVIDGFNGFILKDNTPAGIAETMRRIEGLGAEEYRRLSLNAERSNREHSLEAVCTRLLSIYRHLASADR